MIAAERESPPLVARAAQARSPFVRLTELLTGTQPGKPVINLSVGEPQHAVPDLIAALELPGDGPLGDLRGGFHGHGLMLTWVEGRPDRFDGCHALCDQECRDLALDGGAAGIADGQRADLYPSTYESGYYDIGVAWQGAQGRSIALSVNGRQAAVFTADGSALTSTARVHLPEGISEIELTSESGVSVEAATTPESLKRSAAAAATTAVRAIQKKPG